LPNKRSYYVLRRLVRLPAYGLVPAKIAELKSCEYMSI